MSMIDCKVNIERKPDPKGDRVLLTFEYVLFYLDPEVGRRYLSVTVGSFYRTPNGERVLIAECLSVRVFRNKNIS